MKKHGVAASPAHWTGHRLGSCSDEVPSWALSTYVSDRNGPGEALSTMESTGYKREVRLPTHFPERREEHQALLLQILPSNFGAETTIIVPTIIVKLHHVNHAYFQADKPLPRPCGCSGGCSHRQW